MKNEIILGSVGTGLSVIGTATQTSEILQIISMIITIIGGLITFIVLPLLNWYQKAKSDGKIDEKEIKEGIDILNNGINELKDKNKEE